MGLEFKENKSSLNSTPAVTIAFEAVELNVFAIGKEVFNFRKDKGS